MLSTRLTDALFNQEMSTVDERLTLGGMLELFERILPVPPDPMPPEHTTKRYLWEATLYNSQQERPRQFVQLRGPLTDDGMSEKIITVECDRRGRGIRVLTI